MPKRERPTSVIACRVPIRISELIDRLAKEQRRSQSAVLRNLLEDALKSYDFDQRQIGARTRRQTQHDEVAERS